MVRRQSIRTYPPGTALLLNAKYQCSGMEETIFDLVPALDQSGSEPFSDNLKSDTKEFHSNNRLFGNYGSFVFLANIQIFNLLNISGEDKDKCAKPSMNSNSMFTNSYKILDELPNNLCSESTTNPYIDLFNITDMAIMDENLGTMPSLSSDHRNVNTSTTRSKGNESSTHRNLNENVTLNPDNNDIRNISVLNTIINDFNPPNNISDVENLFLIQNGSSNTAVMEETVVLNYTPTDIINTISFKSYTFYYNNNINLSINQTNNSYHYKGIEKDNHFLQTAIA